MNPSFRTFRIKRQGFPVAAASMTYEQYSTLRSAEVVDSIREVGRVDIIQRLGYNLLWRIYEKNLIPYSLDITRRELWIIACC